MANQTLLLLGSRIVLAVLFCKINFWDIWCLPWMSDIIFVVCIDQLSTGATKMLTVLSVGYGWQYPFQGVYDFFEIMKCWCLVFFDSQCPTWHGNCFVSLSKWDWNCMVKQFLNWNLICLMLFLDDISPIHFDFVFSIGTTAV